MIYKMSIPNNPDKSKQLMQDIFALGVKNISADHEYIFRGDVILQEKVAELAFKYMVNAGWTGE